jgi:Methyltransferase domain
LWDRRPHTRGGNIVGPAGEVVGIDPTPLMLARVRDNGALAGKWLACRLVAVEHLPFADLTFAMVLASVVLHHLPPEVQRAGAGVGGAGWHTGRQRQSAESLSEIFA